MNATHTLNGTATMKTATLTVANTLERLSQMEGQIVEQINTAADTIETIGNSADEAIARLSAATVTAKRRLVTAKTSLLSMTAILNEALDDLESTLGEVASADDAFTIVDPEVVITPVLVPVSRVTVPDAVRVAENVEREEVVAAERTEEVVVSVEVPTPTKLEVLKIEPVIEPVDATATAPVADEASAQKVTDEATKAPAVEQVTTIAEVPTAIEQAVTVTSATEAEKSVLSEGLTGCDFATLAGLPESPPVADAVVSFANSATESELEEPAAPTPKAKPKSRAKKKG